MITIVNFICVALIKTCLQSALQVNINETVHKVIVITAKIKQAK